MTIQEIVDLGKMGYTKADIEKMDDNKQEPKEEPKEEPKQAPDNNAKFLIVRIYSVTSRGRGGLV